MPKKKRKEKPPDPELVAAHEARQARAKGKPSPPQLPAPPLDADSASLAQIVAERVKAQLAEDLPQLIRDALAQDSASRTS